jgi:multimeric flavodoxin WrbA
MSKNIMILCGSPRRNGNTNRVVKWFAEGASAAGAEVEIVDTARMNYKTRGCIACMGCQGSEEFQCTIEDEAQPVIARIPEADVLVMATPVYWFGPTAQLKLFMDRMFSLVKEGANEGEFTHPLGGKTMGLISTAGGEIDGGLSIVDEMFHTAAQFLDMKYDSFLVPSSPSDPEEMEGYAKLRKEAEAFGRKLAE